MTLMNGAAGLSAEARLLTTWHADKLRDEWQCRLLAETKGKTAKVALAIVANSWAEAMEVICNVVWPGFVKVEPPLYAGHATIRATGQVVCDYVPADYAPAVDGGRWYRKIRNALVYEREDMLIKEFRDIADRLKFSDKDREAMFAAIQRWVSRDERIGPEVERKK